MTPSETITWQWSPLRNGDPGQAGDLANNFRNEGRDPDPGIFEREPIANTSRFLAREFIQNTVDASRDPVFTDVFGEGVVEVVFRFVEISGRSKRNFAARAGLQELSGRAQFLKENSVVRSQRACLATIDDEEVPLRLLYAEEYGTSGMYGPWDDDLGTSKMSIAMLSGNVSDKPDNAGGSFGHGKSVNAMASNVRVNFAYTCFTPSQMEPDVSRRLLGVAYWPEHTVESRRYWGFGLLGNAGSTGADERVAPWTNSAADAIASDLGFALRSADDRHECGTTLLIIDPDLDPSELATAIERYWWPAISDGKLRAKVIDYDGTERPARPKNDPVLKVFDAAYRAIKTPSNQADDHARVRQAARVAAFGVPSGVIGMCPAPVLPDDALAERQSSLVAYIRGLGMVVKYRSLNIGPTFVSAAFVASDDERIERLLVKSEPKTHGDWLPNPDGVDPGEANQIRIVVNNINESVRAEVKEYSALLSPPRVEESFRFRDLDRELAPLLSGGEIDDSPEPVVRDFSIRRKVKAKHAIGAHQLSVAGEVRVERRDDRISRCKVSIRYFLPDDSSRGKPVTLSVRVPDGFEAIDGDPNTWVGPVDEDPLTFKWETPPYDRDWEGELDVEVKPVGA